MAEDGTGVLVLYLDVWLLGKTRLSRGSHGEFKVGTHHFNKEVAALV